MNIALFDRHVQRRFGTGLVNSELTYHLARAGHQVALFTSAVDRDLLALEGVSWRRVVEPDRGPFLFREICFVTRATQALSTLRGNEVIHLTGGNALGRHTTNTCHLCHSAAVPDTSVSAGRRGYMRMYRHYNARLECRVYRQTGRQVVAVSEKVRRELVDCAGVDARKVVVIHNGVDLAVYHDRDRPEERRKLCAEWSLPPDASILLFAGDVRSPSKGLPVLLEAMHLLRRPGVLLLIAGGELPPALISRVRDTELHDRVRVIGFRSDMPHLLRGADAFIFPSAFDACPTVVLQAMGTACPLIVSSAQYCGTSELLTHGESAFLLDNPLDAREIARAIETLVEDTGMRERLARAARDVVSEYTWERMAGRYERMWNLG